MIRSNGTYIRGGEQDGGGKMKKAQDETWSGKDVEKSFKGVALLTPNWQDRSCEGVFGWGGGEKTGAKGEYAERKSGHEQNGGN